MPRNDISRRQVLRRAATGAGVLALGSAANATEGPDRKNVGLAAGADFEVARWKADSVHRELDFGDVGRVVSGRFSDRAASALENNPNVRYVEDEGTMHALAQQLPWGIDRVDAEVVHADGETGAGVDVAIIDTGIDSDHFDLAANIGSGKAFVQCVPLSDRTPCRFGITPNDNPCNQPWDDDRNHGTHVAGSAGAIDDSEGVVGVAPDVTLHAGKVLDECGSGSTSDIAAAVEWATDQGHDVINMSLGGGGFSQTMKDAVTYAHSNGVLVVAAAGNDGPCSDCVSYPAAYEEVVAVSGTADDDTLYDSTSTGPEVEIAAPGEDVLSTLPPEETSDGLGVYSGTSMASPHVAGAGAQLVANGYSNTEARQRLKDTAEDIGFSSNETGAGLLDVEAAVGSSGGDNTAPSASIVNPADGDTVSGTVTIQVDAADSEDSDDSLDVEVSIDGGTYRTATYNSTSGYYEDDWDTTGVSDGDHTVDARATDSNGATTNATQVTVTVDNGGSGASAPAIDLFGVTDDSNPRWSRYYVDWAVSDADGDLADVTTEMLDASGGVLATDSSSVSGSSASGTHYVESKSTASEIRLTVTDSNGNTTTDTRSV